MKNLDGITWSDDSPLPLSVILEEYPIGWASRIQKLLQDMLAAGWDGKVALFDYSEDSMLIPAMQESVALDRMLEDMIDLAYGECQLICEVCGAYGQAVIIGETDYSIRCLDHSKGLTPL